MTQGESSPDDSFSFTTDATGIITGIGPEVCHLLGYTPEELIGKPFFDIIASGPVRQSALIREALTGMKLIECLAVTMACRDGSVIEAGISAFPVAGTARGNGCIGVVRRAPGPPPAAGDNVTEAELFLDLVCHDLSNMNQIEAGYVELAMQSVSPGSEAYGHLERCISAIEVSSSLIHNVQKLHQIRTGIQTLEPVDLVHVIGEVVNYYREADSRCAIINFCPASRCQVLANGLLKDAFLNIIGNAIRHSSGTPVVDIQVSEIAENGAKCCEVTVEDNGPGIPDDMKKRLFQRFQSGNTPTSGKGLGLYLVKKLIEGFRGAVWVEDRVPGDYRKGSRFIILLPAADGQAHRGQS